MNAEIKQAKFQGFQFGIEVARQLIADSSSIDLRTAISFARKVADGEHTTTDPENTGEGFNQATKHVMRTIAHKTVEAQRCHASDVCEGLDIMIQKTLKEK